MKKGMLLHLVWLCMSLAVLSAHCRPHAHCCASVEASVDSTAFAAYLSGFHEIKNWKYVLYTVELDSLKRAPHLSRDEKARVKEYVNAENAYMCSRSDGNVSNTHREIPVCYGSQFLWRGFDDESALGLRYRYGGKVRLDNGDWVCFVYREDPSCLLPFGKGVNEVFLLAYSPVGRIKARHLVAVERNMVPSIITLYTDRFWYSDQLGWGISAEDMRYMFSDSVAARQGERDVWTEMRVRVRESHSTYAQNRDSVVKKGVFLSYRLHDDYRMECKEAMVMPLSGKYAKSIKVFPDNRSVLGRQSGIFDVYDLDDAYHYLRAHPADSAAQMRFFNAFPSTWTELTETYRYRLDKHSDLHMYLENCEQMLAFEQLLGVVPDEVFLRKYVNLCKGGIDPDLEHTADDMSISYFVADKVLKKKACPLLRILQDMTFKDQLEFWRSLFHHGYEPDLFKAISEARKKYGAAYPVAFMVIDDALKYYCNNRYIIFPMDIL